MLILCWSTFNKELLTDHCLTVPIKNEDTRSCRPNITFQKLIRAIFSQRPNGHFRIGNSNSNYHPGLKHFATKFQIPCTCTDLRVCRCLYAANRPPASVACVFPINRRTQVYWQSDYDCLKWELQAVSCSPTQLYSFRSCPRPRCGWSSPWLAQPATGTTTAWSHPPSLLLPTSWPRKAAASLRHGYGAIADQQ
jgi:hypothetical protein